jgi:hypothetical protein
MEPPDHLQCQRALAGEHLVHTIATADKWSQIVRAEPLLLHVIFGRFNQIRQIKPIVPCLRGLTTWQALQVMMAASQEQAASAKNVYTVFFVFKTDSGGRVGSAGLQFAERL